MKNKFTAGAHFIGVPIQLSVADDIARGVQTDGNGAPKQIQLLRVGNFIHPDHPEWGVIEITPEMLSHMVANFSADVLGIDIAIDYNHNSENIAAAWVKDVFLASDGTSLWAEVDWTPTGGKKVAEKELRYLSADFAFNYVDNETLEEFGPTLRGAGLTNRPVVKRMAPALALAELKGNESMSTRIRRLSATPGQAPNGGAAAGAGVKPFPPKKKIAPPAAAPPIAAGEEMSDDDGNPEADGGNDDQNDGSDDGSDDVNNGDLSTRIAALQATVAKHEKTLGVAMSENAKLRRENAQLHMKAQTERKNGEFNRMLAEGKVCEAQRDAYCSGDMDSFITLGEASGDAGVNLNGKGHSGPGRDTATISDAVTAKAHVRKLAEELVAANKCKNMDEAFQRVFRENPKLSEILYPRRDENVRLASSRAG